MAGFFIIFAPMKHLSLSAFLLLLAVLAACNSREAREMEDALEQAVAVYGDGSLDVEVDTVVFIPGLSEASGYFADRNNYGKAALAALYNGYTEKDFDKEAAMVSFKDAERYGELAHDSLTTARADYWMGKMLYYDGMLREGLSRLGKANALLGKRFAERTVVLNGTAATYVVLREYDSAAIHLDQSLQYADSANSSRVRNKAFNNYAVLHELKGEYVKALECLRLVEPENNEQRLLNSLNLGDAFNALGETDSAASYYERVEALLAEGSLKLETKVAAYRDLADFYERRGDLMSSVKFKKEYEECAFGLLDNRNKKSTYRIQQQYDYEVLRNTMNLKVARKQRIIIASLSLVVLLTIALAASQRRLAVKTLQEAEARKLVAHYIQQYRESAAKQGETMGKVAILLEHKDDRALLDDLSKTVFGKKDPWEALVALFDSLHPGERENLNDRFPDLTDLERKSLLLSYFNISRQDEELLLHVGIHTVDKLRQSVKKKTQGKPL